MLEHKKAERVPTPTESSQSTMPASTISNTTSQSLSVPSHPHVTAASTSRSSRSARHLYSGRQRLAFLEHSLSSKSSEMVMASSSQSSSSQSSSAHSEAPVRTIDPLEVERLALERDKIAVDAELAKYIQAGLENDMEDLDLLHFWTVSLSSSLNCYGI